MKECLLNFVQDLFKFPWTREEFLRCNSFRESYDVFHDRLGDCSFEEYVEFFKEFNLECSTLEKSISKLSDEQLEQVSGGGIGRFLAIPMVALTLLSGVSSVTGFAASIKAPKAVSFQAGARDEIQDEWAKTRDFVARAGDPWLSMLPLENETGFAEYKNPEVDFDEDEGEPEDEEESSNMEKEDEEDLLGVGEKVRLGKVKGDGIRKNVCPNTVPNFIDVAKGGTNSNPQEKLNIDNNISGDGAAVNLGKKKIVLGMEKKDKKGKVIRENVYPKILETVNGLVAEAAADQSRMPEKLKIAKHIYEWIAKKMKYDNELADRRDHNEREYRAKPGVVFERKDGVCAGFAKLARLMMRMAEIPCAYVGSPVERSTGVSHAFNAIYVEKTNGQKGWTLMDATWGMQDSIFQWILGKTDLHKYFPAAYDNKSLTEDNNSMMGNIYHQVKSIDENYEGSYILNGVKYTVHNDSISVSSEEDGANLSLQIPKSILALNKKIKIESGIRRYKCSGTEEIDISNAKDLTEINTDDSRISNDTNASQKYEVVGGVLLYEKNGYKLVEKNGGGEYYQSDAKELVGILPRIGAFSYSFREDGSVYVSADPETSAPLRIPQEILNLKRKIVIGPEIRGYICMGNEEIDISEATDLQSITGNSERYSKFEKGVLYYKDNEGRERVAGLSPGASVIIDGFKYSFVENIIYVFSTDLQQYVSLKVPLEIQALRHDEMIVEPGITQE